MPAPKKNGRKVSIGKWRVGVDFNPSGSQRVDAVKKKGAALIDEINNIPAPEDDPELANEIIDLKDWACRVVEEGTSLGVKAATKKPR